MLVSAIYVSVLKALFNCVRTEDKVEIIFEQGEIPHCLKG